MTPQELTILIDAYSEVYSNVLTEEVAEVGQSPTPGGVKKAPPSALPQRKKGQPITSIKDSYEIVLDYLIGEGFAPDKNSAEQIMLGMSEAWVGKIVEQQTDPTKTAAEMASLRNTAFGSKKFQDGLKLSPSNPNSPNFDPKSLKAPGV